MFRVDIYTAVKSSSNSKTMKHYAEDEETAKKMVAQQADVIEG